MIWGSVLVFSAVSLVAAFLAWLRTRAKEAAARVAEDAMKKVFERAKRDKAALVAAEPLKPMTHEEIANALRDIRDRPH